MSAPSRPARQLGVAAAGAAALVAMVLDTTFVSPDEAAAARPAVFSAEEFVDESFPDVVTSLTQMATDITELAPAVAADPAAAGKEYGTDVGSGKFAYAVTATGTVTEVDADFAVLQVPGLPPEVTVRIPLGAAVSGTPVRDAPGTITFSDFVGQTDFQSVANQLKIKIQSDVLSTIEPTSLAGQEVTVVGAWATGGPPSSFIIQPVSIEVGP